VAQSAMQEAQVVVVTWLFFWNSNKNYGAIRLYFWDISLLFLIK